MTTLMDVLRYECGMAGEEAADLIESQEKENAILLEERDAITKERDDLRAAANETTKYGKLKDCPFCGASWGPPQIDKAESGRMVMVCMNPHCGASTGWCDSEEEAVALWNKRPNVAANRTARSAGPG